MNLVAKPAHKVLMLRWHPLLSAFSYKPFQSFTHKATSDPHSSASVSSNSAPLIMFR
jgi:hypothetical protein